MFRILRASDRKIVQLEIVEKPSLVKDKDQYQYCDMRKDWNKIDGIYKLKQRIETDVEPNQKN